MSCQAINVLIEYVFKGFDSIHDVRRNQLVAMTIDVLLGDGSHGHLVYPHPLIALSRKLGEVVMEEKVKWIQNNNTNHHGHVVFYLATLFKALILSCFVHFFSNDPKWYIFTEIIIFETRKYFVKYDENISLYTFGDVFQPRFSG